MHQWPGKIQVYNNASCYKIQFYNNVKINSQLSNT